MLTPRQKEVLQFIEEHLAEFGMMPSTREIQEHFGFASQTAAMNHLRALERKGVIQRLARKARAVALATRQDRHGIVDVPLYGQIAAGMPAITEQETGAHIAFDAAAAGVGKNARTFALRVRGDSMIGAHILDGDIAVLEMREPRSGDIVAALIDGETTLKRLLIKNRKPCLRAENPEYPALIPAAELLIQGVLVSLLRKA